MAKMKKKSPKKTAAKKSAHKKVAHKKTAPKKKFAPKRTIKAKKPAAKKVIKVNKPVKAAKPLKVIKPQKSGPKLFGIPEQMRDAALKILDERQAEDIACVELMGRSSVADYMIIASGRAGRQIAAIAHYLREEFEKFGIRNPRIEGLPEANWVLVDAGDVIVHLFRPEVRRYYHLEDIWNDRKVM